MGCRNPKGHRFRAKRKEKELPKLLRMVMYRQISKILVAYPYRLTRFGFKTLEAFFKSNGAEIILINEEQKPPREELIEDLIIIVSHFARRLYGMGSHKYKTVVEGAKRLISDP